MRGKTPTNFVKPNCIIQLADSVSKKCRKMSRDRTRVLQSYEEVVELCPSINQFLLFFCEKLRSGDAGERDNVSPSEMDSGSCVSSMCGMLFWLPWLFSRKLSLVAESWSSCNTSQSACVELCGQGSAGMYMSSGCFGCMVLSVSL